MNRTRLGEATRMEILTSIKMYRDINGYSPSIREIARMVNIKSTSTIHKHLKILKDQGKIDWNPLTARSIIVRET
jgi:SOS-response transcriptional repressor LexA